MLHPTRLLHLFRQTPIHDTTFLARRARRAFAKQPARLPSPQARSLATARVRPSIGTRSRAWTAPPTRRSPHARRHNSSRAADDSAPKSLSDRMKEMSRKYGWTVTGIYLGLSALDFPFCFLAVRWFGTERIAEIEHTIVEGFWTVLEKVAPSLKERRAQHEATEVEDVAAAARDAGDQVVKDARHKDPGLGTQLLLAYGVHKSLIFFRIPLTVAITPKVVKTLRKWGWQIGKPKTP